MQFSYQTTLKDFRVATLYGTFMRNAGLFRIMRWLLPSGAVYLIGSYYELWPFNSIALFLLGGYIVWLLILLGNAELTVFRYSQNGADDLQKVMDLTLTNTQLFLAPQGHPASFSASLSKLACVVKLRTVYLIYISAAQTLIVPRCDVPNTVSFDEIFRRALANKFVDMQDIDDRSMLLSLLKRQ